MSETTFSADPWEEGARAFDGASQTLGTILEGTPPALGGLMPHLGEGGLLQTIGGMVGGEQGRAMAGQVGQAVSSFLGAGLGSVFGGAGGGPARVDGAVQNMSQKLEAALREVITGMSQGTANDAELMRTTAGAYRGQETANTQAIGEFYGRA